jgi:hypothetical protein
MAGVIGYIQVTQGEGTKMKATKSGGIWTPHHIIDDVGSEAAFYTDALTLTAGVATQLSEISTSIKQIFVRSAADNGSLVFVITSAAGTVLTGYELGNGESIPIVIDDISKVWVISAGVDQKITYIAS